MKYRGSCHCGRIAFEVEAEIDKVIECNCSICQRRGSLLFFVPREQLRLETPEGNDTTYKFNRHAIEHHFCPVCGCAPYAIGKDKAGGEKAAINARCLEGVDPTSFETFKFDGRSL
jgi:hypothetical protein